MIIQFCFLALLNISVQISVQNISCIEILFLFISTVIQMVTKFAGVKMFDPLNEDKKKENMTLDDSLLILANI